MSLTHDNIKLTVPTHDESFKVRTDEATGLRLILPAPTKQMWNAGEEWYRSTVVDRDDRVVSVGWPKFKNAGEGDGADTKKLTDALVNGDDVLFLEKMDGSLCIRSVVQINGEPTVIIRSRGSLLGDNPYGDEMRRIAAEKYPRLLDTNWMADRSLLFEMIHDNVDFRIVIKYDKPDLVFIGGVMHNDLHMLTWDEMQAVALDGDLNTVTMHILPKDMEELCETIIAWEDKEGIVCRVGGEHNEQILVKIKAGPYIEQHYLATTALSESRVYELCLAKELSQSNATAFTEILKRMRLETEIVTNLVAGPVLSDAQSFIDLVMGMGLDYELALTRLGYFETFIKARNKASADLARVDSFVAENSDLLAAGNRKDFAARVMEHFKAEPALKGASFARADNKDMHPILVKLTEQHIAKDTDENSV